MRIVKEKVVNELSSRIIEKSGARLSAFHWHEKYEICCVVKNSSRFLVDGKVIEADEGDLITINERIVHRFLTCENDSYIRIIQFPYRIILNSNIKIKPLKAHIPSEEIKKIPDLKPRLDSLFEILDQERAAQYADENPFFMSLLLSLYLLLMRNFAEEQNSCAPKKDRAEFYKIAEYVNSNFKEDINVNIISANLYIPRKRLAAIFKRYSGMGLSDYINSLRVKNVNELINEGYNITEAALESGFQCIRTFNNVYKSYIGMTPTEYINQK
ncbi:MAG: AraC family transcriptional regulator [Clostridia bacterium]|nr:AraC family transcriptional regulator [Clostridia bacterium]